MTGRRIWLLCICAFVTTLLAGCGGSMAPVIKDGPPKRQVDVSKIPNAKPRPLPKSRYGNPPSYTVNGRTYHVLPTANGYNKTGIASWYGTKFNGKLTSSREPYNMFGMTAASTSLPIPTFVRVTNLKNHRSVVVKVNDRGPFVNNRIIDLSYAAAKKLGYAKTGTALVQVTAINVNNPGAAPPPIRLDHNPRLYLQLGAFTHYSNATRLRQDVERYTAQPVRITEGVFHGKPIYRVQVGPLKGVGQSDKLQMQLETDGLGRAITVIG